jgi:hypothetical protein
MARDLIPPPSPAGRPPPDPEQPPPLPAQAGAVHEPAPTGAPAPSPFRARFGFVMGALAGCAVAAATLLIVLRSGDGARPDRGAGKDTGLAADWSPWHPRSEGTISGAQEIAARIGGTYKDAKSKKLASIKGGPIALNTLPAAVAIPAAGDRFSIVNGVGIQYTLAGFGKQGRLQGTKPSEERRRLLRREALELSLYSFRYLPEVTMVVALLPPAPPAEQVHPKNTAKTAAKPEPYQPQALFYRPGDLRKQLERPLATTMATKAPRIDTLARDEAKRIDKLTLPNLFTHRYIQQQDGSIYLVLDRPS